MLGDFTFHNPTKLYFGENSLENLSKELGKYGEKVMLVYGGGSIRKNGIYDAVQAELRKAGKQTVELSGVMPNPTIEKVMEGVALARKEAVDFILAVGGGSVCDYGKAVAGSAYCEHDPWEYYFNNFGEMTCRWIPVGCVLTMAGTGSEMDSCSVISKHSENRKKFYYFRNPDFSILNPVYTYTVPKHHTVAGIYDIMSHILEQYLSGTDDNTTDYIAEGLMRSLVVSSRKVLGNPEDYEARSNIMWTATWALNGLLACGKPTDWMVHMLGAGCRRLYRRNARTHALGSQRGLLPSAHRAFRRCGEKIPPTGNLRVGYCSRRKDGQGNRIGRARTDGGLDAGTGTGNGHHGLRCRSVATRRYGRCVPYQRNRLCCPYS